MSWISTTPCRRLRFGERTDLQFKSLVRRAKQQGTAMIEASPDEELTALLKDFDEVGGVLDYVKLRARASVASSQVHRAAALAGVVEIDRRLEKVAEALASDDLPGRAILPSHLQ